ncbi:MAG TPA: uroporphyrinogen decarboxylase [Firmicutes bacterium]|jgi:uroporphyrinogen decarboxylase|nr:uroporphyrinogen decarboxylase [Bacillota bacterium]
MNCRERVIRTLRHEKSDIVPYHLDLTDEVYARLEEYYHDSDFFGKTGSHLAQERNESFTILSPTRFKDMFGVVWNREQEGDFGIVLDYILKDAEFGDYVFPKPDEKLIREKCQKLQQQTDKFRMYIIGFSLFERAWTLRSMTELLIDFKINPEFAGQLLDKIVEYNLAVVDIVSEYDIDCIFYGDDWGQQKGLIMGPALWREFIKPRLKRMYDRAKEYGMYVCQHSCGDIREVFPDLIELGLDAYNTFQPEIYNVGEMKKLYGDKITFYGGISTQRLLPMATPEEVKSETRRLLKLLGENGGYIVAPTHSIPNDVSTENILAFLEVVQNQ